MPPLLGPADSFNSSSATIRPSKRDDDDSSSALAPGRALGPADSVGREFESLLAGRAGVLQSDTGLGDTDALSRYLNDYNPQPTISPTISPTAPGLTGTTDFNLFARPTDDGSLDFFGQVEQSLNNTSSDFAAISGSGRPTSALSNHSVHSYSSTDVSDQSYVTTDMDTDAEWPQPSPSPLTEMGQLNIGGWANGATISPDAEGLGSSSRRRRRTVEDEQPEEESETKRNQRLEHRRSINRRSAQKHRLRRKEELEHLTKTVAERDASIAQLRQELAVAKAQLKTMYDLVQRDKK